MAAKASGPENASLETLLVKEGWPMSTRCPSRHGACWVLQILLFIFALAHAGAAEPEPVDDRDVPELQLPGVEALPSGVSPDPWTTWVTGQDIDGTPRISIDFSFGSGTFAPSPAGSGENAPTHAEFNDIAFGLSLRIGYNLSPGLGLVLGMLAFIQDDGSSTIQGPSGPLAIRSKDDSGTIAAFAGLRLSLPLAHIGGGRLLKFSRTEAPTGVAVHFLAGLGPAMISGMEVEWGGESQPRESQKYWVSTVNAAFLFGLRLEYRWVNFGLFIDFTAAYLGRPKPSYDPLWADISVAGPMVPMLYNLGVSVHF